MREGEIATPSVNPTPTIGTTGRGGVSTVEITESNDKIQGNFQYLNSTFSTHPNITKAIAANFSAFDNSYMRIYGPSEDVVDLGRIASRVTENPEGFTQSKTEELQNITMPRLLGAKQDNDVMMADIETAKGILPDSITYLKMPAMNGMPATVTCALPNGENISLSEAVQRFQSGTLIA